MEEHLSSDIKGGNLMSCIFKAVLISWRVSRHTSAPSALIKVLLSGKDGLGEGWLSGKARKVPSRPICIMIELLLRTLISEHY